MDLFSDFNQFIKFMKNSKFTKSGIPFNISYFLFVLILYLYSLTTGSIDSTIFSTDFKTFYISTILIRSWIHLLYFSPLYIVPFRYLPSFCYFFIYYSFFPLPISYILNNIVMIIIHFFSIFLLYVICIKFYDIPDDNKIFDAKLFMAFVAPLLVPNLMLGQVWSLFIFCMLGSIFFFENAKKKVYNIKYNNFYGGLLLGISITIKPFALLVIPFLIGLTINFKQKPSITIRFRELLARFSGFALVLLPNLIIFLQYPSLLSDFISINAEGVLDIHHSTSITRIIFSLLDLSNISYSRFFIIIFFTIFFFISPIYLYLKQDKTSIHYSFYYGYAMLILLLSYPDSWFLYLLIWYALQFPAFMKMDQKLHSESINKLKWIMLRIVDYSLVWFWISIIIHYLLIQFDPIFPVLITLYYILFFKLHQKLNNKQNKEMNNK